VRQILDFIAWYIDRLGAPPEKFIKISFWGLNAGLALMVIASGLTYLKIRKGF